MTVTAEGVGILGIDGAVQKAMEGEMMTRERGTQSLLMSFHSRYLSCRRRSRAGLLGDRTTHAVISITYGRDERVGRGAYLSVWFFYGTRND